MLMALEEIDGLLSFPLKSENTRLHVVGQFDPNYQERLTYTENDDGTVEFTSGQCLEILLLLQMSMNFSFLPIKGSGWMGRFPNGSWSGMAAQLVYEGADLSISQSAMLIDMNKLEAVSFLHPTSAAYFMALFHQPKASSYRNLITSVFSNSTLFCYSMIWIVIVLSIRILFGVQNRMKMSKGSDDSDFVDKSTIWAIATACVAGWYGRPITHQIILVAFTGSYLAYICYVALIAGITRNLVTELDPIQNVEQLASSKLMKFKDKLLFVPKDLFNNIANDGIPNQLTIQDALTKLLLSHQEGMAFVTFADGFATVFHQMNFQDNLFCDTLSTVMLESAKFPTAMAVKRGSPIKNALNFHIVAMGERGFLHRLNKHYDLKTQIYCLDEPHSYRGGLALHDTWTAFAVLAAGFILGLILLKCESMHVKTHDGYL